jgi:hypothetical protein
MQQKRIISSNINSHQDKGKVKTMGIIIYQALRDALLSRLAASDILLCRRIISYQTMQRLQTSSGLWNRRSKPVTIQSSGCHSSPSNARGRCR